MNKKGLGYITVIFLLIILTVGLAVSNSVDFDLDSFKNNLNWTDKEINVTSAPDLGEALEDVINGFGGAAFNMGKWAAELAYNNPNVPWKLIMYLLIFALLSPIVVGIIKVGAIVFILIKEFISNKKEKKELKILKSIKEKSK